MPKSGPAMSTVAPAAAGCFSTNSESARQAANNPSAKPMRLTRFRYSAGIIWSVSTLLRRSDRPRPLWVTKGSMRLLSSPVSSSQVRGSGEGAGDRRGRRDLWRDEVRAGAFALAAFEVAVGRGRAALAGSHGVRVHAQAHRAPRRPPLRPGRGEHRVQAFLLGRDLDLHRAR